MNPESRSESSGMSGQTHSLNLYQHLAASDLETKQPRNKFIEIDQKAHRIGGKDLVQHPDTRNSLLMPNQSESPRSVDAERAPKFYNQSPSIRDSRGGLHARSKQATSDSIGNIRENEGSLSRIRSFLEKIVYTDEDNVKKGKVRLSENPRAKFKQASHMIGKNRFIQHHLWQGGSTSCLPKTPSVSQSLVNHKVRKP